jgi:hypothetical protein
MDVFLHRGCACVLRVAVPLGRAPPHAMDG